jgi:hypothetical protein
MPRLTVILLIWLCALALSAAEPPAGSPIGPPPAASPTPPASQGRLLLDDELARPPSPGWRTGKGLWTAQDGGWKGVEVAGENHAASARRNLAFRDAVIRCEVRLDGARSAIVKLNGTGGHCCQVVFSPDGVRLQRYTVEADAKRWIDLAVFRAPLSAGEWYALTLELRGGEAGATIEGLATPPGPTKLRGKHATLDVEKSTLVLNVAGDSASFRNLSAWKVTK